MDLWIRSQDKKKLVKCESVSIGGYKSHKDETALWCGQFNCGTYKTEKRALEVLDEIQKLLEPEITFTCNGNILSVTEYTKIYEMPKD